MIYKLFVMKCVVGSSCEWIWFLFYVLGFLSFYYYDKRLQPSFVRVEMKKKSIHFDWCLRPFLSIHFSTRKQALYLFRMEPIRSLSLAYETQIWKYFLRKRRLKCKHTWWVKEKRKLFPQIEQERWTVWMICVELMVQNNDVRSSSMKHSTLIDLR